jgi:DNA-binding NtrC family response regulator
MNHDFWVVLVEDEFNQRKIISDTLSEEGFNVKACSSVTAAKEAVLSVNTGCIISDFRLDDATGEDFLIWCKENNIDTPFIIITAFNDVKKAVSLLKMGARDYFTKPLDLNKIINLVHSCIYEYSLKFENSRLKIMLSSQSSEQGIVSKSPVMLDIMRRAVTAALKNIPLRITGETGTGKELFARFIHDSSPRSAGPFIPLNCAAILPNLIESELFGHVKGAFTGAVVNKKGSFEAARGGTVFLDEIAELPLDVQAKFLRVLQEKRVQPLGSSSEIDVDFRLICASHKDLKKMTEKGLFRQDLYFRLNVVEIDLPPLRERKEDIPLLSDHFLNKYSIIYGSSCKGISKAALDKLIEYPWPGNVRELENVIQSAIVFAVGNRLEEPDIHLDGQKKENVSKSVDICDNREIFFPDEPFNLRNYLDLMEKKIITHTLMRFEYNKSKAARHLKIDEKSIRYKIKKYSLE